MYEKMTPLQAICALFMLLQRYFYNQHTHTLRKIKFFFLCIGFSRSFNDSTMLRVKHECDIETKHEDILFPPDRSFFQKIHDDFRCLLMASNKNPGAYKYLRSRASIVSEKRRHLRNYRYTIHPFSIFRYVLSMSFYNLSKYL